MEDTAESYSEFQWHHLAPSTIFGNLEPATWEYFGMAFSKTGYIRKKRRKRRRKRQYLFFFFNAAPTIFWTLLFAFHVWSQIMLTINLGENLCPYFINVMIEVQRC